MNKRNRLRLEREAFVVAPCLACGATCTNVWWSGAVGPFCSQACRDKNDDKRLWERANAYAERVMAHRECMGNALAEADIARAFVIGYSAGFEDASSVKGRRTVKP